MVWRRGAPRESAPPDRAALQRERQQLLTRLVELERQLGPTQPEKAVISPPERR